ncbi:MAG: zinc ribbon domain-containing protein [Burkholderiales bacterium]
MPIYAYKCASCGLAKDVLQKLSEPPLTVCPACGEPAFSKQVTAAGFQLKGSGWYATDFKGGKPTGDKKEGDGGGKDDGKKSDDKAGAKSDGKSDGKADGNSDSKSSGSDAKGDTKKSDTGSNVKSDTKSSSSTDSSAKPAKPAAGSGSA